MTLTRVVRLAAVAAAASWFVPSLEAAPKNGRGNIQAVDWNVMQMAIKGVDGKVNTFRVKRDASVKISGDGGENFPNPTLRDLAASDVHLVRLRGLGREGSPDDPRHRRARDAAGS